MTIMNSEKITILAMGDMLLGRTRMNTFAKEMINRYSSGAKKLINEMKDADIIFANLEAPIGTIGYRVEKPGIIRAPCIAAQDLKSLGIDVVSLANNHMLDYGYDCMFQTISLLNKHGIRYTGAGKNIQEAMKEASFDINGIKIAFLSFSCTLPLESGASDDRPGIVPIHVRTAYQISNPEREGRTYYTAAVLEEPGKLPIVRTNPVEEDLERIEKHIRKIKKLNDFVIIGIHWGLPYQEELCEYEISLGHSMIDSGADVIIGHHPHRIHAIEIYKGKPIFYSVGNFILYTKPNELLKEDAIMVKIIIEKNNISAVEAIPIKIDDLGYPFLASGRDKKVIMDLVNRLSLNLPVKINDDKSNIQIL